MNAAQVWGAVCKFIIYFTFGLFFRDVLLFMIISLLTVQSHKEATFTIIGYLIKPFLYLLVI